VKSARLLVILAMILFSTGSLVAAQTQEYTHVYGAVTNINGAPLQNVTVYVQELRTGQIKETVTNGSGYYGINVSSGFSYNFYFLLDLPNTSGYDYVPSMRIAEIARSIETLNVSTSLFPGASIYVQGDAYFVENGYAATAEYFKVLEPSGFEIGLKYVMRAYGDNNPLVKAGILDDRLVVVPADMIVKIGADSRIFEPVMRQNFVIDNYSNNFYLKQGELTSIDLWHPTVLHNLDIVNREIESAKNYVESFKGQLYLQAEINDINRAELLVDDAQFSLAEKNYDASIADLREAYLLAINSQDQVRNMYESAQGSAFILVPLLTLFSFAVTYLLTEKAVLKVLGSFTVFIFFLTILYFLYPGYVLLDQNLLYGSAIVSFLAITFFIFLYRVLLRLAPVPKEGIALASAIVITFSIAKRNIRRRKLLSSLTLISVLIFVAGSFVLTSSSIAYGYHSEEIHTFLTPKEGLMIRKVPNPPLNQYVPFLPLQESLLDWLSNKSEIKVAAPKVENRPVGYPLVHIQHEQWKIPIYGVLGILPSAEVETTNILDSLSGQESSFLNNNSVYEVLISVAAAEKLHLNVGDKVNVVGHDLNFTVIGFLSDSKLDRIRDLDIDSIKPKKLVLGTALPCESDEIIVMTYGTALSLHELANTVISRVNVLLEDSSTIPVLTREIVLQKNLQVWSSFGGRLYLNQVGEYLEVKGIEQMFIPLVIVVLNVAVTMLNYVHTRKKEIYTMSTLGLNPTHIATIFLSESILLGIVSGVAGYLLGLGLYHLLPLLPTNVVVRQKVSAEWSIFALLISLMATTLGAVIPATRATKIATASLQRKWKLRGKIKSADKPWRIPLPVSINPRDVEPFLRFVKQRLNMYEGEVETKVENIMAKTNLLRFDYVSRRSGDSSDVVLTRNTLIIVKKKRQQTFGVEVIVESLDKLLPSWKFKNNVEETVVFIRKLLLEWSDFRGRMNYKSNT